MIFCFLNDDEGKVKKQGVKGPIVMHLSLYLSQPGSKTLVTHFTVKINLYLNVYCARP